METTEPLKKKAGDLAYTIGEIVQQIRRKGPLSLYEKGDRFNFDFYGIVERVWMRIGDSFQYESRVGESIHGDCPDGLVYELNGRYDHKPLLSLLEEALSSLRERKIKSMEELQDFYTSFRSRLLELRYV